MFRLGFTLQKYRREEVVETPKERAIAKIAGFVYLYSQRKDTNLLSVSLVELLFLFIFCLIFHDKSLLTMHLCC